MGLGKKQFGSPTPPTPPLHPTLRWDTSSVAEGGRGHGGSGSSSSSTGFGSSRLFLTALPSARHGVTWGLRLGSARSVWYRRVLCTWWSPCRWSLNNTMLVNR